MGDWAELQRLLDWITAWAAPAAQLVVRWQGQPVFAGASGWLDPNTRQHPVRRDTLFDLASLTKLFATTAFMVLVEEALVYLEQPVVSVLNAFHGVRPVQPYEDPKQPGAWVTVDTETTEVNAETITFRHLLTHTSGLPAWRPLYRQPTAQAAREMALSTFFAYRPGAHVIYSDIGLILLGLAIERLTGEPLDRAVQRRVTQPLGLPHTHYLPIRHGVLSPGEGNVAPTELCPWRGYRLVGEVHDENAWRLGGVSAHAGLFSTAEDVAVLGESFLDAQCLRQSTIREMTRLQAQEGGIRRGLGFALWSPNPEASSHPFSGQAFGHTGFTGTSLWIDPTRELVVALLTNEVYRGRRNRRIGTVRLRVHKAIVEVVSRLS